MEQENQTLIDINHADEDELTQLRGVGTRLAKRIVAARPYESIDELTRVRGISTRDVERLRPFVTVEEPSTPSEEGEPEESSVSEVEIEDSEETIVETEEDEIAAKPEDDVTDLAEVELAADETLVPLPEIEEDADEILEEGEISADQPSSDVEIEAQAEDAGEVETDLASEELEAVDEEAIEETPVVEQPVRRQPAYLTRGSAFGLFLVTFIFSTILAVAITLGILSSMNRGGLMYASPDEVAVLRNQLDGFSAQVEIVADDLDSLRTRMDNLEALSGRVSDVESDLDNLQSEMLALQTDIDSTQAEFDELTSQMEDIDEQIETLSAQNNRHESFLEGLRNLIISLFPEEQE